MGCWEVAKKTSRPHPNRQTLHAVYCYEPTKWNFFAWAFRYDMMNNSFRNPIKAPVSNLGVVAISASSTPSACSYASDDNMTYFGTVYIDTKDSYVEVCTCIENHVLKKIID